MKCVISTVQSYGDRNISRRGTQFKFRYIHECVDTAADEHDLRELVRAVFADAQEMGYYCSYSPDGQRPESRGRPRPAASGRHVPLSPREIALAARLNSAEQQAKRLAEINRKMRMTMQAHGLRVEDGEAAR